MRGFFKSLRARLFDTTVAFRKGPRYAIRRVSEIPDRLKDRPLYVMGKPKPWSVALLCPCGCKETIHISLLENDSPSWSLQIGRRNKPSLEPSIWRREGVSLAFFPFERPSYLVSATVNPTISKTIRRRNVKIVNIAMERAPVSGKQFRKNNAPAHERAAKHQLLVSRWLRIDRPSLCSQ